MIDPNEDMSLSSRAKRLIKRVNERTDGVSEGEAWDLLDQAWEAEMASQETGVEAYLESLPSADPWLDDNPEAKASVERGLRG